jgi:hypothetical protein
VSEHLSALALDELAVGDLNDAAAAHLEGCDGCRARLRQVKEAALHVTSMPDFERTLDALELVRPLKSPPSQKRRKFLALTALAVSLAAAVIVLVLVPRRDDTRLKGTPTVELLLNDRPVTSGRPGDTLTLAVGGAGHTHAVVVAVDANGAVSRLWPVEERAGAIAPGARVLLSPSFDVTPGSLLVLGFFTDGPQPATPVIAAVEQRVSDAIRSGRTPFQVELPSSFGHTARLMFEVAQ